MNPPRIFDEPETEEELIREAQDLWKESMEAMQDDMAEWRDDLAFDAGEQWPENWRAIRELDESVHNSVRPCLVIPRGHVHTLHIQNSIKSSPPGIKARPVDDMADPKTAEIITGLIRHISSFSKLGDEWGSITETQVPAGVGYIRAYPVDTPGGTELQVSAVPDIFSVLLDPHAKNKYGADSGWWFVTDDMAKAVFEKTWPDVQPMGWKSDDSYRQQWVTEKTVRVVEFMRFEWRQAEPAEPGMGVPTDYNTYKAPPERKKRMVWRKLCAMKILEEKAFPIDYIPMIRVPGEVIRHVGAEGHHRKVTYRGMVNRQRDSQITYNVMKSTEVERIGLTPLAPFIAAEGQTEAHPEWKESNVRSTAVLTYTPKSYQQQLMPPPQRQQGVIQEAGILAAAAGAAEDLRAVSGQQLANEQDLTNDASGIALERRQVSGDIATYHYPAHIQGAADWLGTILINMAPKVFAKRHMLRILGEDDEPEQVKVDPRLPVSHEQFPKIDQETGEPLPGQWDHVYNLGVGQFDVVIDTGPQFETKRQEGAASLKELLMANPAGWPILGDLFFKSLDIPYADEMAKRMRKTIDPKLLEDDEEQGPAAEAKAQIQQAQQVMMGLQQELQQINQAKEVLEAQAKQAKAEADKAKAQREMEEIRLELENTKLVMGAGQMDQTKMIALTQALDQVEDRFASKVIEKQKRGTRRMLTVVPRRNGSIDAESVGPLGDDYPPGSKKDARVMMNPDGTMSGFIQITGPQGQVLSRKTIRAIPNEDGSVSGQVLESGIGPAPTPGPPPMPPPPTIAPGA